MNTNLYEGMSICLKDKAYAKQQRKCLSVIKFQKNFLPVWESTTMWLSHQVTICSADWTNFLQKLSYS
jgi:hypothetical protein